MRLLNRYEFDAVVFDMDGLMFDTENLMLEKWAEAAREFGLELPREVLAATIGLSAAATRDTILAWAGPEFPYERVRARRIALEAAHFSRHGVPLKPCLLELLQMLRAKGLPLAVATSTTSDRTIPTLQRAGILEMFSAVTCGDHVSACKPDPEIYLVSADRLGVPPACCLVLEDSNPGIAAAAAAGCLPVMVPDLVEPDERSRATVIAIFRSLCEVRAAMA